MSMNLVNEKSELANLNGATVRPITPSIGAIISGIDIASVTREEVSFIRSALLKHKVIALRGQNASADEFFQFGSLFGETTKSHPTEKNREIESTSESVKQKVWERDNTYRSDHWHTDVTFIDRPVSISMLRCVVSPDIGGDTVFANTVKAYERLPECLKALANNLRAIHSFGPNIRERMLWNKFELMYEFVTEHPVVRVHSETGERSLLLGSFAEEIVGVSRVASSSLINIFQDYITKQDNLVRWSWKAGDLVMWDNRATQHYAVNDYGNAERMHQRLTLAGGIPVGVDGKKSVSLRGDASGFSLLGPA